MRFLAAECAWKCWRVEGSLQCIARTSLDPCAFHADNEHIHLHQFTHSAKGYECKLFVFGHSANIRLCTKYRKLPAVQIFINARGVL